MRTSADRSSWTLRTGCVVLGFGLLLIVIVSTSPLVFAAQWDRAADRVLGQLTFETNVGNQPALPPAGRLSFPTGVSVDPSSGRLFVADRMNWRVQSWPHASSFANGASADLSIKLTTIDRGAGWLIEPDPVAAVTDSSDNLYIAESARNRILVYPPPYTAASYVIGQQFMTTTFGNQFLPFPTASTLKGPFSLATDNSGHLFVADLLNSRVLRYKLPITKNNQAAELSLGQAGFDLGLDNRGNSVPSNNSMAKPQGVAVDSAGAIYVADTENNRVLKFSPPLQNGMAASLVLGQPNFVMNDLNQGRGTSFPTAQTLNVPSGVAVDKFGRIYVGDFGNGRIVGYNPIGLANGGAAQFLLGQPDFETPAYGPAPPTDVSVGFPYGLAVDSAVNVYVADRNNNRVLGFDMPWGWEVRLPMVRR